MLRTLIREAAAEGSLDRALAADSPNAVEFFARLKRALVSGYFVEEDARTGRIESVAVPGYVFWPEDEHSGMPPVGFGLFRALDGGYELWLAGLELGRRGGGHGRALLDALFATPPGKKTWVVRIPRGSRYGATVQHLLSSHDFESAGETTHLRWFLRKNTPPALAARVRGAIAGRPPLN
ncbi:MAG TPA: hypothetical protein VMQ50_17560 [Casimicrobiaceae bacterium]|nr:hypothetical protein [Casimicrobiaceae bacterium]